MNCIYCDAPSDQNAGLAHILPEAIFPGGPTLPRGQICNDCNHYFGQKLESQLVRHPFVAFPLQLLRLPGKRGRPRNRIGTVEADPEGSIRLPVGFLGHHTDDDGVRAARVTFGPWIDPHFELDYFRRALHLVAFNFWTWRNGHQDAQAGGFADVRRYIRSARAAERWGFMQDAGALDPIAREVGAKFFSSIHPAIVRVRLFNVDYYVDLLHGGQLASFQTKWRGTDPTYIDESIGAYPKPPDALPGRYGVTIY